MSVEAIASPFLADMARRVRGSRSDLREGNTWPGTLRELHEMRVIPRACPPYLGKIPKEHSSSIDDSKEHR